MGLAAALAAELRVLEAGLPQSESIVEGVRTDLEVRTATLQALLSTELKLDQLRSRLRSVQRQRDGLPEVPNGLPARVADLMTDFREADARVAEIEASLRETGAWDVDVRGGYDQVLGQSRDIPAFATVTVSVSLGSVQQKRAHARGLRHRAEWRRREFAGLQRGAHDLLRELDAQSEYGRVRLGRLQRLREDLRERLALVGPIEGEHARRHWNALWFEHLFVEAEAAHWEARLPRLATFLAAAEGTTGGAAGVATGPFERDQTPPDRSHAATQPTAATSARPSPHRSDAGR